MKFDTVAGLLHEHGEEDEIWGVLASVFDEGIDPDPDKPIDYPDDDRIKSMIICVAEFLHKTKESGKRAVLATFLAGALEKIKEASDKEDLVRSSELSYSQKNTIRWLRGLPIE